jgi:Zinc metalloprotease (elastase)
MNRKHLVLGLVAAVLGVVAVVACIMAFLPGESVSGSALIAARFPVVNETYPVYRTVSRNITDEDVQQIGKLFNLSGEVKDYIPSAGIYRIDDCSKNPCEYVEVSRNSGTIRYKIPEKAMPYSTDRQPVLPSDEEAIAIATRYLQERGLLFGTARVTGVSTGSQYGTHSGGISRTFDLTRNVRFSQGIDGISIDGSGTTVTVAEYGEVVAVSTALSPIDPEPIGYVKVISPEEAYRRFLAGDLINRPACCYDQCVVRDITLVYYRENLIAPAYAFRCDDMTLHVRAMDPSELERLGATAP